MLYYKEEGDVISNMLYNKDILQYTKQMRAMYYSIDNLDFQSIVLDSMWSTVQNKHNIEDEAHFINYYKQTLKNKLIDQIRYNTRTKRYTEEVVPYTEQEEEIGANSSDYSRKEILLLLEQEKVPPLCRKYAELIMDSNIAPSDMEASRILNCDRRTIKKYKQLLQEILIQNIAQEEFASPSFLLCKLYQLLLLYSLCVYWFAVYAVIFRCLITYMIVITFFRVKYGHEK